MFNGFKWFEANITAMLSDSEHQAGYVRGAFYVMRKTPDEVATNGLRVG